jgi:parallel beta-helix repeat protein
MRSLGERICCRRMAAWLSATAVCGATVGFAAIATVSPAAAASCAPAGTTGFTAAVVATQGQMITGTVDATGCNVGVYIGPGVTGVTVSAAMVENATDHGILAENTSNVTIQNNTLTNNGTHPNPKVASDDAIFFSGVSGSTISGNTESNDYAGGIRVTDDGPFDPGAPNPGPATVVPSSNDTISGNKLSGIYGGCALLVGGYNAGNDIQSVTVSNNTITGAIGQFGAHGPVVGQIVIAGNGPGVTISGVVVSGNTITQSIPTGIILHANAPGDVITGTSITGNTLSLNNWGKGNGGPEPTAIGLEAEAIPPPGSPTITQTTITGNKVSAEYYGVWISYAAGGPSTTISGNTFNLMPGGYPVFTQVAPGVGAFVAASNGAVAALGGVSSYGSVSAPTAPIVGLAATRDSAGYWLAGRDGNVYPFGDAGLQRPTAPTSLVAQHVRPASPIVGITATPDVAGGIGSGTGGLGYWLVASDGGVFTFGDAPYLGSTGAMHLNKPIVGLASAPDGQGYWLVASDGGVFTFGDAHFFGSTGAMKLNKPIVAIAPSLDGQGYFLVASDGGVFTFGDAHFFGSLGGQTLAAPIVGMKKGGFYPGYDLADANGKVYSVGLAPPVTAGAGKIPAGAATGFDISGEYPMALAG